MNTVLPVLIRTCAAFAVALAGGALSAVLGRTHKQLCALISLGAGTLLGVAVFAILPECLDVLRWWQFLLAAITGYVLFSLISRYVFHVCPACAASHFDEVTTRHFGDIAIPMMAALAIHCAVDGLALTAGHEEQSAPTSSRSLDLSVTLAICVHKVPEGLALGALLLGAGFARGKMLWLVAAVELTTVVGGIVGWFFLRDFSDVWLALALAHAAGGFLYLATHAVIGELVRHHKTLVLTSFLAGFGVIGALILLFHLTD